jgi:predicted transcriptional regulator with HTH domain
MMMMMMKKKKKMKKKRRRILYLLYLLQGNRKVYGCVVSQAVPSHPYSKGSLEAKKRAGK